jgi:hypothetical protein
MQWKAKPKVKEGDRRTREHFALFPVRIGDTYVWLETYFEVEEWRLNPGWPGNHESSETPDYWGWKTVEWRAEGGVKN